MKRFTQLVEDSLVHIEEIFPWDLLERLDQGDPLLLDVREPYEFDALHIQHSINVPRGILESASEFGYEETVPCLATARKDDIIVICRSGNRSALAAHTLRQLGFARVSSLKTGLRGWNDFEQPLYNVLGVRVPIEDADHYFTPKLSAEQLGPQT